MNCLKSAHMKTKKYLTLMMLLFSSFLTIGAQTNDGVRNEFERALREKGVLIETITSQFTQVRSISVLSNKVVKHGKFYYSRPGNIFLSFDDGDYIKMTDAAFRMKNAGKLIKTKISVNPMLKELKRLLSACMIGDILKAANGFKSNIEDASDKYIVKLTPAKNRVSSKVKCIVMKFSKKDMSLTQLKMEEASGDFTSYDFTDKIFNSAINENLFKLD